MTTQLLQLQDIRQVENLELLAKQVVEGFIVGLHKSPFHGFSVEFAEHRIYNAGESTRHIDWKVYGRTDRMYSKKYEEETNLRCQLVLDTSSSMYFPDQKAPSGLFTMNKVVFSAVCAAAVLHMMKSQRDAAGLTFFDEDISLHTRAGSGSVHQRRLFTELEKFIGSGMRGKRTGAARCLHQIAEQIPRRSLVILFTDMMESGSNTDELFSSLQHLKYNKHEVILFHVTDKNKELLFEYENRPYQFVDMETGEKVRIKGSEVKEVYARRMADYMKEISLRCHQYKIDFIEADIQAGFKQVLLPYLMKRMLLK